MALAVSGVLLGAIMYGIIPGVITMATRFELLFVNGLGMPYNIGVLIYALLLLASLIYGIYLTQFQKEKHALMAAAFSVAIFLLGIPLVFKSLFLAILISIAVFFVARQYTKNHPYILNTILVGFMAILLGYSSIAMIVIRSNANPPMDQNDPENLFSLLYYLNREQYGDRPLLHGPTYNAPILESEETEPVYSALNGKYEITSHKIDYKYNPRFLTLFPRMYSRERNHVEAYEHWGKVQGTKIRVQGQDGKQNSW
ncbi:MAG: hypothetical protein HC896_16215 [Bacteroidales bacterium]|nr:hypothetical protein [Bacteroidales bacterium]